MPDQCGLVILGDDKARLTVCLPSGSGVRTIEVSPKATAGEAIAQLAGDMKVEEGHWKLYARSRGEAPKAFAPTDKLASAANASYYFYPLP